MEAHHIRSIVVDILFPRHKNDESIHLHIVDERSKDHRKGEHMGADEPFYIARLVRDRAFLSVTKIVWEKSLLVGISSY